MKTSHWIILLLVIAVIFFTIGSYVRKKQLIGDHDPHLYLYMKDIDGNYNPVMPDKFQ